MQTLSRLAVDRATLHLSKVEEFARWAVLHGYSRQPPRGPYEALRLQPRQGSVLIWYRRDSGDHATCAQREKRVVRRWLTWRLKREAS